MPKTRIQVRRAIAELVESRMFDQGVTRLSEVRFEGELCPLINPMCPEDLCYLPRDHVGTKENFHVLGTTAYDCAEKWPREWLQADHPTRDELIQRGWDEAERRFG